MLHPSDEKISSSKELALVFLIDTSSSMTDHIDILTENYNSFINELKNDKTISDIVALTTLEFNSDVNIIHKFQNVKNVGKLKFTSKGTTNMLKALNEAKAIIDERMEFYYNTRAKSFKPWVILMTDGYPDEYNTEKITNIYDAANALRWRSPNKKEGKEDIHIACIGCGDNYEEDVLLNISDKCYKLQNWDFKNLFDQLFTTIVTYTQGRKQSVENPIDIGNIPRIIKDN